MGASENGSPATPGEPGDPGSAGPVGQSAEEELADDLDKIAVSLEADCEKLSRERPRGRPIIEFWREHLETVIGHIDRVQRAADKCNEITGGRTDEGPLADLGGVLSTAPGGGPSRVGSAAGAE
jgi:hypothetical protein